MPYVVAIFGIGILGNILVRKAKTRTVKMMVFVPSMIAVVYLFTLWMS